MWSGRRMDLGGREATGEHLIYQVWEGRREKAMMGKVGGDERAQNKIKPRRSWKRSCLESTKPVLLQMHT